MLKKLLIFFLPLLLTGQVSASTSQTIEPTQTAVEATGQSEILPSDPQSQEVDYVQESELARKMKQAKKAHDAETYDAFGGGITIIAMCIVVGALVILSILFLIFGRISSWFMSHKKKQTQVMKKDEAGETPADTSPDSGDVIAAISAALAQHFATDHDKEDTILTIKRMRKAYSPWNSKIYNMRHEPQVVHNHPQNNNR